MTAAATRPLAPFDFRADFAPPEAAVEAGPETIRLTAEEVLALISKVRSDALAEAARQETAETLDRLEAVAGAMRTALADMVQLMGQIEAAGYDTATEERLRGTLNAAARRLIDGQGDLFERQRSLSARLDKTARAGPGWLP